VPSIPQYSLPTFIVVPVGTPPPVPRIVSPGGVIAPYSPYPTPMALSTSTPSPGLLAPPTAVPAATVAASAARPSTGGGGGGGGAGPTALLGVALAAAFITVTELRDRRRTA
jgi:hypothetical protein